MTASEAAELTKSAFLKHMEKNLPSELKTVYNAIEIATLGFKVEVVVQIDATLTGPVYRRLVADGFRVQKTLEPKATFLHISWRHLLPTVQEIN